jgi:Raf kinase inhibitor-like YbhB/YbcL family protein
MATPYDVIGDVPTFTVTSDDVRDGDPLATPQVSGVLGAGGDDVSPQLSWSDFPEETQSFAITVYDPDAPTGSGFWHWSLVNLPVSVTELQRGLDPLPEGAFCVRNDYGEAGYGGAAPPPGDRPHRYVFAVHALDVDRLDVPTSATPAYVGFNLAFHTLARATIRPTFQVKG